MVNILTGLISCLLTSPSNWFQQRNLKLWYNQLRKLHFYRRIVTKFFLCFILIKNLHLSPCFLYFWVFLYNLLQNFSSFSSSALHFSFVFPSCAICCIASSNLGKTSLNFATFQSKFSGNSSIFPCLRCDWPSFSIIYIKKTISKILNYIYL